MLVVVIGVCHAESCTCEIRGHEYANMLKHRHCHPQVAGLRVMHGVTELALRGVTRLAVRTERLDLIQPLSSIFPALLDLELG